MYDFPQGRPAISLGGDGITAPETHNVVGRPVQ